jgi:hypothetical protein
MGGCINPGTFQRNIGLGANKIPVFGNHISGNVGSFFLLWESAASKIKCAKFTNRTWRQEENIVTETL